MINIKFPPRILHISKVYIINKFKTATINQVKIEYIKQNLLH